MIKSFSILTLNSVLLASLSAPIVQAQDNSISPPERPVNQVDLIPVTSGLNENQPSDILPFAKKKRGLLGSVFHVLLSPFSGSNDYYPSSGYSYTVIRPFGSVGHCHSSCGHS